MATLPAQPGPLIGRADELAFILRWLRQADSRLLTLTGTAGAGKTRLAVEAARQAAAGFAGGAHFVDLAPIHDSSLVGTAIAQAIELREQRSRPLLQVIKENIGSLPMLLVLDNFEQVLAAAPQLSELIQACPELKLLVTSRSALRLRWEHGFPVPPLADVAAVELFVHRAQRLDPHFGLTPGNAEAVKAICARLDCLPLAIELAAARTRVLPPQALLSRLGHRLQVLQAPGPDQPPRQRTLRAALDWSFELLSPAEQALFRRLGVFVGGFPLGAVVEVCDADGELGLDPLAGLESLVDKSLVRRESQNASAGDPRFGMLETVREYALERLRHSGERELIRERHARYFLGGADVPVAQMKLSQQSLWLESLEAEHDNLRAALAWCAEARVPELGLNAGSLLAWFWVMRGYVTEGRQLLTALLDQAHGVPLVLRAESLRVIGSLALHQTDYAPARVLFEMSLAIRRELGDPAGVLSPLSSLGAVLMQLGEMEAAEASFAEALSIQEALADLVGIAESTNSLANLAHERGDLVHARMFYERSLEVQLNGVQYRPDVVMHNLGVVAHDQGDLEGARKHFQDSVAIKRTLGDTVGLALSLSKLGEVLAAMGNAAVAHRLLRESLTLERDLGDRPGIGFVLDRFASAAATLEQPRRALRLAGAAEALRETIGTPLSAAARARQERWLGLARSRLHPEEAETAWQEGLNLTVEAAFAEAAEFEPGATTRQRDPAVQLSAREREVTLLLAGGLSNRDIADRLVLSERTVENHVQHVLNRLGLHSRAQVAAWAVQHGLIDLEQQGLVAS